VSVRSFLSLFAVLVVTTAFAQADTPKGNAAIGKQLFADKGCYSCHGFVGQGSREGPRLTPPTAYAAFVAQLRSPRLIMPPYVEAVVSERQAADIYAYLASQPRPPDPKTLDLLK
jgi:mono/diheme cytochrome c family protein